jgi:hypothetical protein
MTPPKQVPKQVPGTSRPTSRPGPHLSPRSQGLKEDLVDRVEDWPGIHFGKYLLEGRSLMAGKWVDRTRKYRLEMQRRNKEKKEDGEVSPDEYTTTLTVELKPLPCLEHLGWGGYIRFVTELIRDAEEEARRDRERRSVEVVGREEICRRDPQTRPNRVKTSPAPPVHAASKKARLEWREALGMFLLAYREAAKLLCCRGGLSTTTRDVFWGRVLALSSSTRNVFWGWG